MKQIEITKKTKDLRPNRNREYLPGFRMNVTKELAAQYISKGVAKEYEPAVQPIKSVKNEAELKDHLAKEN